jgi:hypothetical protein
MSGFLKSDLQSFAPQDAAQVLAALTAAASDLATRIQSAKAEQDRLERESGSMALLLDNLQLKAEDLRRAGIQDDAQKAKR